MPLADALAELEAHHSAQITAWRVVPARAPSLAPAPDRLAAPLIEGLRRRGVQGLYQHQAEAIEATLVGDNVCIVTPTASGKTLCYVLPTLQALLADPSARALYLFPTKALAQDQVVELGRWQDALDAPISAATYDGDTPPSARSRTRKAARVIVSNPDMLHTGILPHHTNWAAFFEGLRFVVLDEMHTYRGVFGSHVANVLRRLRRVAAFYGASPQFILSSATIANPGELAERLIEAPVTVIDTDGAPRGERHLIIVNPPVVDRHLGIRRGASAEATLLARGLLTHDVQTAVFASTRLATEVILHNLRRSVGQSVAGYRGGYLPHERRATEAGLREGALRGVVTTNALELGVDIGGLDAVILAGYPGTIASAWQQAGRAGRRLAPSAAILVASGGPLDQYIATHPDYLWGSAERAGASPERALINPDNALILTDHLRCAAFELPFTTDEAFGGWSNIEARDRDIDRVALTQAILAFLAEEGSLHLSGGAWRWLAEGYPAEGVSLRTASPERVVISCQDGPDAPRSIGEVERYRAPGLVHPGAIYLHAGAMYHVDALDWKAGHAYVRPVQVEHYTDASASVAIEVVATFAEAERPAGTAGHGEVEVTSKATAYRQVRFGTNETLGWGEIDLPPQTMLTTAYWFRIAQATVDHLRAEGWWRFDANDYGPTWFRQRDAARARDGYRCRACGAPERDGRQHDVHHVRAFRSFGYVRGQNRHDEIANRVENLVTLCNRCHRRAEEHQRILGALSGLANVVGQLAPLYLMCDPRDLGVLAESKAAGTGLPTLTVYEQTPAGLGFAAALYDLHATLMNDALELIRACPCDNGCPGCIGPTTESDPLAKRWAIRLLQELA